MELQTLIDDAMRNLAASESALSAARTDEAIQHHENNVNAYRYILTELERLREKIE